MKVWAICKKRDEVVVVPVRKVASFSGDLTFKRVKPSVEAMAAIHAYQAHRARLERKRKSGLGYHLIINDNPESKDYGLLYVGRRLFESPYKGELIVKGFSYCEDLAHQIAWNL